MVGGNIPGVTRTISIAIYDEVQALNYAAASATALFLLVFSFAVLALTYGMQHKVWGSGSRTLSQAARRYEGAVDAPR
jgi:molybdate transport system permease protein